ncbi:LPS export ABC transporter permease LptF [Microbulbifer thermotolerans]|uniref:Lipopolysaccharide export system permease protein LptF n=1 Tax=Microbulbifer thermotolerans TaxID=252514 RepID=A0A143HNJ4_MICTH|nr:LPS export ABC transporter permease LptF [Microbulbifer thermotolerans]AMX03056.1 LPS export ABC transporter permease LptF [Microbulbifer thermotolerans]MCX2779022.1 LPS export ABC transporter permease LptF [Microbulbifer thermotolerans]MCX2784241.1 LPS export ABC transporter permease LptF [Microbulbifer thermotolerans]MCX2795706.1 LPS export ABC transporter permease LptF [Microbulbifer thermotolerans]MCX2802052.1 LPS export ABC transporter permease LptF [Microbulbifer thermotolerans]
MIIFRYLCRELLFATLAVSAVLLLMVMSGRFVKYLAEAAAGDLSANILFALMGYRLPGFLELVLPLGLFVGILLAYGRLYIESEMTVLHACGFSERRLLMYTLAPAFMVALVVASMSLYFSPTGMARSSSLLTADKSRNEFDHLVPKKFVGTEGERAVYYADSLSEDKSTMRDVFLAELGNSRADTETDHQIVTVAREGVQRIDPETGLRYLVLRDGYRYEGIPGQRDYRLMKFSSYEVQLEIPEARSRWRDRIESASTLDLWRSDNPVERAYLHWRFSLPVLVLVVAVLAVPLSRTNPRQGRYAKMVPAVLLYITYLVILQGVRGAIEDGKIGNPAAIWLVHPPFLILGLLMLGGRDWRRRPKRAAVHGGEGRNA